MAWQIVYPMGGSFLFGTGTARANVFCTREIGMGGSALHPIGPHAEEMEQTIIVHALYDFLTLVHFVRKRK